MSIPETEVGGWVKCIPCGNNIEFGILIIFSRSVMIFNKINLDYEGLYFVLAIAVMYFTYSFTNLILGNGFLAVYVAGLVLGNKAFVHKRSILKIFDGLVWLMQIVMFLTLGLQVYPSQILVIWHIGLLITFMMIFFVRPIAVYLSTFFFKIGNRERLFVSWVGLKGAVPIVFATYPLMRELPHSNMIFNIVFFISSISLLIQGTSIPFIAKLLKVDEEYAKSYHGMFDKFVNEHEKSLIKEFIVNESSPAIGKAIMSLQLPQKALVSLIVSNETYIIPDGSTQIAKGDLVMLIAEDKENMTEAMEIFIRRH